jgi:hypothetical protein
MTGIVNSDLDVIWKKAQTAFDRTRGTESRAVAGDQDKQ